MNSTKTKISFTELGLFLVCASMIGATIGYGFYLFPIWKSAVITPISEYLHPHGKLEFMERPFPENLLGFVLIFGPLFAFWVLILGFLVRFLHPSFPLWVNQLSSADEPSAAKSTLAAGPRPESVLQQDSGLGTKTETPENMFSSSLRHFLTIKIAGPAVLILVLVIGAIFLSSDVSNSDALFEKIQPGMSAQQVREILKSVSIREISRPDNDGKLCLHIAWEEPTLLFGVVYHIDCNAEGIVVTKQRMD